MNFEVNFDVTLSPWISLPLVNYIFLPRHKKYKCIDMKAVNKDLKTTWSLRKHVSVIST